VHSAVVFKAAELQHSTAAEQCLLSMESCWQRCQSCRVLTSSTCKSYSEYVVQKPGTPYAPLRCRQKYSETDCVTNDLLSCCQWPTQGLGYLLAVSLFNLQICRPDEQLCAFNALHRVQRRKLCVKLIAASKQVCSHSSAHIKQTRQVALTAYGHLQWLCYVVELWLTSLNPWAILTTVYNSI
jgi:hypothetical protein